eukprot:2416183-Rhodomonas_salina.1
MSFTVSVPCVTLSRVKSRAQLRRSASESRLRPHVPLASAATQRDRTLSRPRASQEPPEPRQEPAAHVSAAPRDPPGLCGHVRGHVTSDGHVSRDPPRAPREPASEPARVRLAGRPGAAQFQVGGELRAAASGSGRCDLRARGRGEALDVGH